MSSTTQPGYPLTERHSKALLAPYTSSSPANAYSPMPSRTQLSPAIQTPLLINHPLHAPLTVQTSHEELPTSLHAHSLLAPNHQKQPHPISCDEEAESLAPHDEYLIYERFVPLGTTMTAPRFRYGRYRFPQTLRKRLVPQIFYDPAVEIHRPAPLQPSEFMQRWKCSPIHFDEHQITHISHEPMHHGIMFMIDIAEYAWPIGHPVQQGMRVEVRGYHEDEVRYMITWRLPCLERDAIYVQVNAYLEDGQTTEFYDRDWPALRLRIPLTPETHVDIPYPPAVVKHLEQQQLELNNQELLGQTLQDVGPGQGSLFQTILDFCSSCTSMRNSTYP